jgi:hypothetical protein
MARKQAPTFKAEQTGQTWKIPKRGLKGEWYPVVRVGRHIPFGYEQDQDDPDILQPIPEELEMLETAKKYLSEYSLRLVARWLSEHSGRYISHVGLKKRVNIEEQRRNAATTHRVYERRAKEAAEKARKLEEDRIGGTGTRDLGAGADSSSESETGGD